MAMKALPPEIRDAIIDTFAIPESDRPPRDWPTEDWEKLKTLRTLLFVSQDVATRARHHLFRSVYLKFIPPARSQATFLDKRRLWLFADIVASSVKLKSLGVLPHICKVFLVCYWPLPGMDSDSDDTDTSGDDSDSGYSDDDSESFRSDSDEESIRDGYGSWSLEVNEVNTPVAKYWGHLSKILNMLHGNAWRIEEFFIGSNSPYHYELERRIYDARRYNDWRAFPKNVQRGIFNLIHSPRLRDGLQKLTVRHFMNVPPDLLPGAKIKQLSLHGTLPLDPSPLDFIGAVETKNTNSVPPLLSLETVDYLLPQVTSLCLGSNQTLPSSDFKFSVEILTLAIPTDTDVDVSFKDDRFGKLGRTLTDFYPSLKHLALEPVQMKHKELFELLEVYEMPIMPIDIRGLRNLTHLHVKHHCIDHFFTETWYPPSSDPSGPPLRNFISILTHCPDTLETIKWDMGFDFLEVVGHDLKREMVNEYQALDRLLSTNKFTRLRCLVITFFVGIDGSSSPEGSVGYPTGDLVEGCKTRLTDALGGLCKTGKNLKMIVL